MASEEAIDAKLEAFENRMEEKMRSLFAEFSIGRPSSSRKSQHGETSYQRDDPQERATTVHSYGGNFLCAYSRRTIELRGTKDKGRSPTSHAEAYSLLYCHPMPRTKKLMRDELCE
ncbi:hypothetical protein BHE74_00040763 [Ensete ventricosum]|nr:hypothetical protein BHE74_00040763 [Ensete ventricosum]